MVSVSAGRYTAFASAVCFEVSGIVIVLLYLGVFTGTELPSSAKYQGGNLDPAYLQKLWAWNKSALPAVVVFDIFISVALLLLAHATICLKKCYRGGQGMARTLMSNCFLIGAVLPSIEFLQDLGSNTAAVWISGWQYLPDTALQSLQISWLLALSRSIYLYALLYVLLSLGLFLNAYLSYSERPFGGIQHGLMGIVVGLVGYVTLGFEIASFFHTNLYLGFGIVNIFWAMILMPAWMVWLGFLLGKFSSAVPSNLRDRDGTESLNSGDKY